MSKLRDKVIRLAYNNPDVRPDLLPFLVKAKKKDQQEKGGLPEELLRALGKIKDPNKPAIAKMVSGLKEKGFSAKDIQSAMGDLSKGSDKIDALLKASPLPKPLTEAFLYKVNALSGEERKKAGQLMKKLKTDTSALPELVSLFLGRATGKPKASKKAKGNGKDKKEPKKPEVFEEGGGIFARNRDGETRGPFKDRKKADHFSKGPHGGILGKLEASLDNWLERENSKERELTRGRRDVWHLGLYEPGNARYKQDLEEGLKLDDLRTNGTTFEKFLHVFLPTKTEEVFRVAALPIVGTLATIAAAATVGPALSIPLGLATIGKSVINHLKEKADEEVAQEGGQTFKEFLDQWGTKKVLNNETSNKVQVTSLPYKMQRDLWHRTKNLSSGEKKKLRFS